jgi:hypothetical protein
MHDNNNYDILIKMTDTHSKFSKDPKTEKQWTHLAQLVYPDIFSQKCLSPLQTGSRSDVYHCNNLKELLVQTMSGRKPDNHCIDYHLTRLWGDNFVADRQRSITATHNILMECFSYAVANKNNPDNPYKV